MVAMTIFVITTLIYNVGAILWCCFGGMRGEREDYRR